MSVLVNFTQVDDVATLEMNRPERKNAMDTGLLEALAGTLAQAISDENVMAVVITGAQGDFSAGADVAEIVDESAGERRMGLFAAVYEVVSHFPKPLVAAISGACIGGGAEVAAGCDLRVGTPQSKVRFPGAQFGIPVGTARLQLLVGTSHAKDLLMTARTFDGDEAYRVGFFNRLVDPSLLMEASITLAREMAGNPGAIQQKRLLAEESGLFLRVAKENRALMRWQGLPKEASPGINRE